MKRRIETRTKVLFVCVGAVAIAASVGFLYLRNSDWWISFTLFSDETRLENFRSFHSLFPAERVDASDEIWELDDDLRRLPVSFTDNDYERSVEEFLEETWTTSLIVAREETILVEEYFRDYGPESLATSFSMAKSVVSTLVGVAIEEGHVLSVHDRVDRYLPSFAESDYGAVSVHDLLTMSSGIGFDEDYDTLTSDVNMLPVRVFGFRDSLADLVRDAEAVRPPGIYNRYVSSDTIVLGLVVEAATGKSLAQLLEDSIWLPAGMESPAYWNTDFYGNALGHAFLSATPRDYLRFGMLYLNDGRRGDREIVSSDWVIESVSPTERRLQPGHNPDSDSTFGYGYQWWIPETSKGDFVAIGIWGQYIYVDPELGVVIVKTSADEGFDERDDETIAFFRSLARWAASSP